LTSFILSKDGEYVAARDVSTIYIIETASNTRVNRISVAPSNSTQVVALSPDGSQLLSANWPEVRLHDRLSGRVLCIFKGYGGTLTALAFHPEGDSILTASTDNSVRLWKMPQDLIPSRDRRERDEGAFFVPLEQHELPDVIVLE
jgi:WD40 repeat protein